MDKQTTEEKVDAMMAESNLKIESLQDEKWVDYIPF
jgi:hypothetical protein